MQLNEKIASRGYWQVLIRPISFVENRVTTISELSDIIMGAAVKQRGWDFPHIDRKSQLDIGQDWVGQDFEWEHHLETWRLYQSGQFAYLSGMPIDWRDQSKLWPADDAWQAGALLGIGDAVFKYSEIFELSVRLALSKAGDESMSIGITVGNLKNRSLYMDSRETWGFIREYKSSIHEFRQSKSYSQVELAAAARDLSLSACHELFERFGWMISMEELKDYQERLLNRYRGVM
jgi:hypothetical protein